MNKISNIMTLWFISNIELLNKKIEFYYINKNSLQKYYCNACYFTKNTLSFLTTLFQRYIHGSILMTIYQ